MMSTRSTIVLSLFVIAISVAIVSFAQQYRPCDLHRIDNCARTGGIIP